MCFYPFHKWGSTDLEVVSSIKFHCSTCVKDLDSETFSWFLKIYQSWACFPLKVLGNYKLFWTIMWGGGCYGNCINTWSLQSLSPHQMLLPFGYANLLICFFEKYFFLLFLFFRKHMHTMLIIQDISFWTDSSLWNSLNDLEQKILVKIQPGKIIN